MKKNYLNMPYGKDRDKVITNSIRKREKELKKKKPLISYMTFPGMINPGDTFTWDTKTVGLPKDN